MPVYYMNNVKGRVKKKEKCQFFLPSRIAYMNG